MTAVTPPLTGRTLILGPSGVGKTTLTAEAMCGWIAEHGTDDVVAIDFAPEVRRDGRVVGGRLDRVIDIPAQIWYGTIEAFAPRIEGEDAEESDRLALANAGMACSVIERMPPAPRAVFVNDVTIPYQAPGRDIDRLLSRLETVECVVVNGFEGEELGTGAILDRERETIQELRRWADTVIRLSGT